MDEKQNNYAFIDSQNLNLAIRDQGWILDFRRFRVYLKEKYSVQKAYLFIGFISNNQDLYNSLQSAGFVLVFKPTLSYKNGKVKGNCDAELVLQAMVDYAQYDKAVIVSGDGDFMCLVDYLKKQNKLHCVLIPNENRYSSLLKKISTPDFNPLIFLNRSRHLLEYKKEKGSK
jgi:uncharacterized LabA/DUF88 family protein